MPSMFRLSLLASALAVTVTVTSGFQQPLLPATTLRPTDATVLLAKKSSSDGDVPQNQAAFPVGTLIEFEEKKRVHVGKILATEHKSNGGARYEVEDANGVKYKIADKMVSFSMPAPNSPGAAQKLFQDFCEASEADEKGLQSSLDISTELLEMAWEESAEGDEIEDHLLTAPKLIELVQGHTASAIEKYLAWKLLKTETAHVFFKEIKDHGRVVAFKAKARKAVESAKQTFCNTHQDSDLCFV